MKRIWIGLGLLTLLMGVGILVSNRMDTFHHTICQQLQEAAQTPQWEKAIALGNEAKEQWDEHRHFTASVTDHENIDQIDGLFAQLQVYHAKGDPISYAATCAYLNQAIEALQEAHRLTWWNLL